MSMDAQTERGPVDIGRLDELGRARLNREVLTRLGWQAGDSIALEALPDDSGVILRLSRNICAHCGETNRAELVQVKPNSMICLHCIARAQKELEKVGGAL